MAKGRVVLVVLALLALVTGCFGEPRVGVIGEEHTLLLPFEASKFLGYFQKNGLEVSLDWANGTELISLLNFSKYKAAVVDGTTARKIEEFSKEWVKLCKVAVKTKGGKPIKGKQFFLLIRKELLREPEETVVLVKGWNSGVDALKDPAVVYALTGEEAVRGYRFYSCTP
ncbi:hypothetical protein [Thermovibrio ammonificans]|uniref:Uncharacterized protein n=1 Tax=Thermovibrio ammonificans (strain DSM 15698 / JCM 12110 / HB-1) TaxID=648996 RepID=E8T440_THEA1|nr:hypothetical protein [Thermovibrio ammonificans]ADU97369.1 hypothetical protein Theam_1406 [Thermovibrio ammonificans HB-1]